MAYSAAFLIENLTPFVKNYEEICLFPIWDKNSDRKSKKKQMPLEFFKNVLHFMLTRIPIRKTKAMRKTDVAYPNSKFSIRIIKPTIRINPCM